LVNTLFILGDKWSLVVVRDIFNGKKSFGEFLDSPEKISTSVLTSTLQFMESVGILEYFFCQLDKKAIYYNLTDKGIDLNPIIFEMIYWTKRNFDNTFHPLSVKWFKEYDHHSPIYVTIVNQNEYKKIRTELLDLHTH
jgi:DNA-binding HxlR family transcriptional regulator